MSGPADLVAALAAVPLRVATAESLTGGLVCAALTDVPGASAVVRGCVVAYATDVKAQLLGVDAELLATGGAVQADVARQMAVGVCRLLAADVGLATTGVAGPDPQDGRAVGTVCVAVAVHDRVVVRELALSGDRSAIRRGTVTALLDLAAQVVGELVDEVVDEEGMASAPMADGDRDATGVVDGTEDSRSTDR